MHIGAWNIRGINTADKQLAVRQLIASEKFDVMILVERRPFNK